MEQERTIKTERKLVYSQFPNVNKTEVQTLLQCMAICQTCAQKCMEEGHGKTASICKQCAEACLLALEYENSSSDFVPQALELCSEVCAACAEECGQMEEQHCKECAEICQRCHAVCTTANHNFY